MKYWAYLQSSDKVCGMAEQCGVLLCFPWDLLPEASVSGSQQLEEQEAERGWQPLLLQDH